MNNRRRLKGVVVSNKMQKTVLVEVSRTYRHRFYKKVISSKNKIMAHDEKDCQIGDQVRIVESNPKSKRKRWAVEEVLKRAIVDQDKQAEVTK
jgi:small subunit ribosomal protein S17